MTTKNTTKEDSVEIPFHDHYLYAVGRRKASTARVRLYRRDKNTDAAHVVNGKLMTEYFPTEHAQATFLSPLVATGMTDQFVVSVVVHGGGTTGQIEAIRHGIARALLLHDESLRAILKAEGYLRRDPRVVERKKPGLKKARRATQWRKR